MKRARERIVRRFTSETLDREIAFAQMAVDNDDYNTREWLDVLLAEKKRRG